MKALLRTAAVRTVPDLWHTIRQAFARFHKTVSDDTGHDHRVLQRQAVVIARSDVAAAYAAKAMLCEACGVVDWRMRADTCEVAELNRQAA